MKYRLLVLFSCFIYACNSQEESTIEKGTRTIIEVEFPKDFGKDFIHLESAPFYFVQRPAFKTVKPKIKGPFTKWILYSDQPLVVNLTPILGKGNKLHVFEPGDSIHIDLRKGEPVFSGRNADKFKMLQEVDAKRTLRIEASAMMPNEINSIQDYLTWNTYLNGKLDKIETVYNTYQKRVTPFVHDYLKADMMAEIERQRLMKFHRLIIFAYTTGIPAENVGQIFDSTANNKYTTWLHAYSGRTTYGLYFYDFVRKTVERQYNFNYDNDSLKSVGRKIQYAKVAKRIYKGDVLQSFWVYLLTSQGLKEHTLKEDTPEIDTLLAEFYAQSGHEDYKQYVREYESKIRGSVIKKNMPLK